VTKTPWQLNYHSNDDTTDTILPIALAQRWPIATWWSLLERALHQAAQLASVAQRSGGVFRIIRTVADLDLYLKDRTANPRITAGWLGIEGAHALDGDPANVDVLYDAGFRMMAPTHFFDNEFGGSAAGARKIGLTDKGHRMIERMQERGMVIDLAHASSATINDVVAISKAPLVVSHTGVRGTCNNQRNLSDDEVRAITGTGGVIGIGYWEDAVGACETRAIIDAILYVGRLVGFDHVGLGSDFDGTVETPFDTCGLVALTEGLLAAGLDEQTIRNVMGENYLRVLRQVLPQGIPFN
jgi:membrane dipeptidase